MHVACFIKTTRGLKSESHTCREILFFCFLQPSKKKKKPFLASGCKRAWFTTTNAPLLVPVFVGDSWPKQPGEFTDTELRTLL